MTNGPLKPETRKRSIHWWVRRAFLVWAVLSTSWLANSVRTRGVGEALLRSSPEVTVSDGPAAQTFTPAKPNGSAALIFICGAGIHPHAYAPLLRPIADAGFAVFVVKLPYRFAPLDSHRAEAVDRARALIGAHQNIGHWVVAGHSLGGALAARLARRERGLDAAFVLIGTTHPRDDDLSTLAAPFTKIYATNDGVAPVDGVIANKRLLPAHTQWVRIEGGNHSQFGHYGHQLFDGTATISREEQQKLTRDVLLEELKGRGFK
jgi:pimeloyl-ACP methyl ester carboxylesterase